MAAGSGWSVVFRKYVRRLFKVSARRRAIAKQTPAKALVAVKPPICDTMKFHRLLDYPGEDITRQAAQTASLRLTGEWSACIE